MLPEDSLDVGSFFQTGAAERGLWQCGQRIVVKAVAGHVGFCLVVDF